MAGSLRYNRALMPRQPISPATKPPAFHPPRYIAVEGPIRVGKSTLAVNIACGLALKHPDDVLLIDTSLQGGTCALLLDLKATTSIIDRGVSRSIGRPS